MVLITGDLLQACSYDRATVSLLSGVWHAALPVHRLPSFTESMCVPITMRQAVELIAAYFCQACVQILFDIELRAAPSFC